MNKFDKYVVNGFEAIVSNSFHAKLAGSIPAFTQYLEQEDPVGREQDYLEDLLERLLEVTNYAVRQAREDLRDFGFTIKLDSIDKSAINEIAVLRIQKSFEHLIACSRDYRTHDNTVRYLEDDIQAIFLGLTEGLEYWRHQSPRGIHEASYVWGMGDHGLSYRLPRAIYAINGLGRDWMLFPEIEHDDHKPKWA